MKYRPYLNLARSSRYKFGDLPSEFSNRPSSIALGHYHDAIESARPETIDSVVVIPSAPWDRLQPQVTLFTFGSFRSVFRTIEIMSQVLADQYLEYGILPVIQPITSRALDEAKHQREILQRRVSRSGLLLLENLQDSRKERRFSEE